MRKLSREFYHRDTRQVAQDLLGKYLLHHANGQLRVGRIVETEAYLGAHDLASHSSKGVTPRTRIMFGPPGFAYVYLIYGMHYCMNVVTEGEGQGAAVLLRALEPVSPSEARMHGPGLLCKAMGIDKQRNGHDLLSDNFYIAADPLADAVDIVARPRIGVAYAGAWAEEALRFYIRGNPYISKP